MLLQIYAYVKLCTLLCTLLYIMCLAKVLTVHEWYKNNYLFKGLFCLLVWRDSLRTFNWVEALPFPELVIKDVEQLLAVV